MKMTTRTICGLRAVVAFPEEMGEGKCPAILMLHGAGTRGTNVQQVLENPFFTTAIKHEGFPFVVVAPQCSENTWFDHFEALRALAKEIATYDEIDPDRLYLMGTSMGGYAAWQLASSLPELFAALVPICGGGMYWNAARLKDVPVWAFHGARDNVVFPEESKKMVDAVNARGGNARLTVYPERDHNAWTPTYSNPEVFAWLLSHSKCRQADTPEENDHEGSAKFG